MSWDEYVSGHLMAELPGGGTLAHAAIIGHDGGIWAQSAEFPATTPEQVASIMEGIEDPSKLATTGIKIGPGDATKFFVIPSEPGSVLRGRWKSDGIVIKKTNTALLVGIYGQGVQAGDANVRVEDLGDYLLNQGM